MPLFVVALGGAIWTVSVPSEEVTTVMLAIPGSAVAELARIAWDGGGDPLSAIALIVAWSGVAAELAKRWFRWEPARERARRARRAAPRDGGRASVAAGRGDGGRQRVSVALTVSV